MMAVNPNCLSTISWLMLCEHEFREGIMKSMLICVQVLGVEPSELNRLVVKKLVFK